MAQPSNAEIKESINELAAYRDRLKKEVLNISKKLRLSQKKIDAAIKDNEELKKIDSIIFKLKARVDE